MKCIRRGSLTYLDYTGYFLTQKAWRIYDPQKRKVQISNNVNFDNNSCWPNRLAAEGEYNYQRLKPDLVEDIIILSNPSNHPTTRQHPTAPPIPIADNHISLPDSELPEEVAPDEPQQQPRPSEALANVNKNNILPEGSTCQAKAHANTKIQTATRNLQKWSAATYKQMPELEADLEDDDDQINFFEATYMTSADVPATYT
ncbi:hypothetical protein Clacol_005727 [Clathrus columnatus]|uniref:Retroviral polymerase SH3-like domain-containing protein n=1 Tax=Clathrus columnatus TaxID=1419009 RepID=A0AAV5AE79_9AGAM|nr:hypothetical protein Clacol_005727 [Clathrus columnatus]